MRSRCFALATFAAFVAMAAPAAAAKEPPPWLKVENGVTQPQFAFANAIEEVVFVETPLDTDDDGARDRIRIRISRPGETESQGIKVPVVFEHSPYRGNTRQPRSTTTSTSRSCRRRASATGAPPPLAPARGQAAAPTSPASSTTTTCRAATPSCSARASAPSTPTGCPDIGGPWETLGTKAVIDWLNGRARGFDEAGNQVMADWTTGAVGMTGVSYNGTLPNQVATTGVEGLKTIIPVSAISSWYDYYRANGLVVAPHSRAQGVGENAFLGEDTDVLARLHRRPR